MANLDNISNILSQEALQGDWDTLAARIAGAISQVQALAAEAKEITFNIKGADNLAALSARLEKVETAIAAVNSTSANFQATMVDLNAATAIYGQNVDGVVKSMADNQVQIMKNKDEMAALTRQIKEAQDVISRMSSNGGRQMEQFTAIIDQNRAKIAELEIQNRQLSGSMREMSSSATASVKAIKVQTDSLNELKSQMVGFELAGRAMGAQYDAISAKAVEVAAAQQKVNEQVKRGTDISTGKYEADLKQKQALYEQNQEQLKAIEYEELWESLIKERAANANQMMAGEARAQAINADIIKQQEKQAAQEAKNQQLAKTSVGAQNTLGSALANVRAQMQKLEVEGKATSTEYAALKEQALALAAAQQKVNAETQVGHSLVEQFGSMLERQSLRFVGSLILWQVAFGALQAIGQEIAESIPGTEAYIQKQEKMKQATQDLTDALKNLNDEMLKMRDDQRTVFEGLNEGVDGAKRYADAIKAIGIVHGATYDAMTAQASANIGILEKENTILQQKKEILQSNFDILSKGQRDAEEFANSADIKDAFGDASKNKNIQYELFNRLSGAVDRSDIPEKQKAEVIDQMNKSYKEGGDILKVYTQAVREAEVELKKNNQELANNASAQDVINTQLKYQIEDVKYKKGIELEKQLSQLHEQLRQTNESADIASVDKVVNDIRAKYSAAAKDIQKNMEEYRKSVAPSGDTNYTDKNIEAYKNLLSLLNLIGKKQEENDTEQLLHQQSLQSLRNKSGEDNAAAGSASFSAAFGTPNYEKLVAALDKETDAKKQALTVQFSAQKDAYIANGDDITTIQKQYDDALIQTDQAAYQKRLDIANTYFQKLADRINTQTDTLQSENSRRHFNNLRSIIGGGGSDADKDLRAFTENQANIQAEANIGLQGVRAKIPEAQRAFNRATTDVAKAPDAGHKAEAQFRLETSQKTLEALYAQEAEYQLKITQSQEDSKNKWKEYFTAIVEQAAKSAQDILSAQKEIFDNQIAQRQQQLDIQQHQVELQSQQQIQAINATVGYQITKENEASQVVAQTTAKENEIQQQSNQLAIKKAQGDKKYAEMEVILNTTQAIMKAYAEFPFPVATAMAALIGAAGAAQYAAAASTPIPQFFLGGTTETPIFSAGERGVELITPPGGKPYLSAGTATIYSEPIGTKITPHDKTMDIINSAVLNVVGGQSSRVPQRDLIKEVGKEVANIIGNKFEEVGGDLAYVIAKSKTNIQINNSGNQSQLNWRFN